jgi:hypothetical protein
MSDVLPHRRAPTAATHRATGDESRNLAWPAPIASGGQPSA